MFHLLILIIRSYIFDIDSPPGSFLAGLREVGWTGLDPAAIAKSAGGAAASRLGLEKR